MGQSRCSTRQPRGHRLRRRRLRRATRATIRSPGCKRQARQAFYLLQHQRGRLRHLRLLHARGARLLPPSDRRDGRGDEGGARHLVRRLAGPADAGRHDAGRQDHHHGAGRGQKACAAHHSRAQGQARREPAGAEHRADGRLRHARAAARRRRRPRRSSASATRRPRRPPRSRGSTWRTCPSRISSARRCAQPHGSKEKRT